MSGEKLKSCHFRARYSFIQLLSGQVVHAVAQRDMAREQMSVDETGAAGDRDVHVPALTKRRIATIINRRTYLIKEYASKPRVSGRPTKPSLYICQ